MPLSGLELGPENRLRETPEGVARKPDRERSEQELPDEAPGELVERARPVLELPAGDRHLQSDDGHNAERDALRYETGARDALRPRALGDVFGFVLDLGFMA